MKLLSFKINNFSLPFSRQDPPRKYAIENFSIFHGFLKGLRKEKTWGTKFGLDTWKFEKFKKV